MFEASKDEKSLLPLMELTSHLFCGRKEVENLVVVVMTKIRPCFSTKNKNVYLSEQDSYSFELPRGKCLCAHSTTQDNLSDGKKSFHFINS